MSEFCYGPKSGSALSVYRHCWHEWEFMPNQNPPVRLERCCWCDEGRTVLAVIETQPVHHGHYLPPSMRR
jgi:hypothetical protein